MDEKSVRFNSRSAGKIHLKFKMDWANIGKVSIPAVRVRYIIKIRFLFRPPKKFQFPQCG